MIIIVFFFWREYCRFFIIILQFGSVYTTYSFIVGYTTFRCILNDIVISTRQDNNLLFRQNITSNYI